MNYDLHFQLKEGLGKRNKVTLVYSCHEKQVLQENDSLADQSERVRHKRTFRPREVELDP